MLNALQAMPGGGELTISAALRSHEQDPDQGVVDLKFHDTGAGIPREQLSRIFDPFFSKRANGTSGSGLGLPVSLAMVKSIGGDITLTSAEGIGTTVNVSLPIVERRSAPRTGLRRARNGRALIIDDDANIRRTLTTLLTRYGYEVVTAEEAEEGLARFETALAEAPFDVVIAELLLARGNAVSALQRIRTQSSSVPILVLTGATDRERVQEALECGAQFAFSKPPNFAELLEVIHNVARRADMAAPQPV
jgi:CheY-like chemotaxis protein